MGLQWCWAIIWFFVLILIAMAGWLSGRILLCSPGSLHRLLRVYEIHYRLPTQGGAAAIHRGLLHGCRKIMRKHLDHKFFNIHEVDRLIFVVRINDTSPKTLFLFVFEFIFMKCDPLIHLQFYKQALLYYQYLSGKRVYYR